MPHVVANGLSFHVQALGDGAPLAVVHGLVFGDLSSWYFTAAPRLALSRRVLLYDLRGHGRSEPATTGFDLATMRDDLEAVLDAVEGFGSGPVDVAGHSYGGPVALRLAIDRPERVRRLVLVDAPLPPFDLEETRSFLPLDPVEAIATIPDPEQTVDLPEHIRRARRSERRSRLKRDRLARFRDETSLRADMESEPPFTDAEIGGLAAPTLCVYGNRSPFLEIGRRIAATAPDGRLEVLDGGHLLPIERPAELVAAMDAFLDR